MELAFILNGDKSNHMGKSLKGTNGESPGPGWWIWMERLSLDAVLVVVLWALALGLLGTGQVDGTAVLILGLATWLVYVGDRLLDVRRGTKVSARHRFYARYAGRFAVGWGIGFVVTFYVAISGLHLRQFEFASCVAVAVFVYWAVVCAIRSKGLRLLFKRLLVPIILSAGVGVMTEAWRSREALVCLGLLFLGASLNLCLISIEETRFESGVYARALGISSLWLMCVLALLGILLIPWSVPLSGAALYGALAFGVLRRRLLQRSVKGVRMWSDAILADMAFVLLLLRFLGL